MQFEMQGLQKLKCATCGTMFMSETETVTTCPSCSEESHSHHEHGTGGCGHQIFLVHIQISIRELNFLASYFHLQ
jgi:transposase-like protein